MVINSNISAIIQARLGSTRLPNKVLKTIQGSPMLWHIVNRLKNVKKINNIIVATSDLPENDLIEEFCSKYNILCFRGSEKDVLKRFYDTALFYNAEHIIRITGDCPLVDYQIINNLIKFYLAGDFDFSGIACGAGVSNEKNIKRYPDGLDAEIFSYKVLREAYKESNSDLEREHVTPFIWQNKDRYTIGTLYSKIKDYSNLRLTVDDKVDFDFINWIYDQLYPKNNNFTFKEIEQLLNKYPNISKNKHLIGKEGYNEFWN